MVKQLIFDTQEDCFYLLCNMYMEKIGFYLMKLPEDKPINDQESDDHMFVIKLQNMLSINDASIDLYMPPQGSKELLLSYKSIYLNTFTVVVFDISS